MARRGQPRRAHLRARRLSAAHPDRARPPAPGAVRPFDFPPVHARTLEGGVGLRVARLPRLPVVSLSLVIPAGEAGLADDRAGHAVLTADALEGGTRRRSGTELAEALEGIGASLHASAGWDATTVSLGCLADRLDEALPLLAEVVLRPAFPEDEVARIREQQLARLRQREMDPGSLASDRTAELMYAPGLPYARPLSGTMDTVGRFDNVEAAALAAEHYRPRGSALVVAGDVEPDEVAALATSVLAGWDGQALCRRDFAAAPRFAEATVHVIDRPGAVQSEIRVGHPGVAMKDPDYYALGVANSILGGAFTSRLNLNLRERHGFTYGVRSHFAFRRSAGPFVVSTAVGTDVTADAVREILHETRLMAGDGPTEEEVEAARDYIAGIFPLRLETTGQVASRIAELVVYDLPDDHHARYRERIRAVTRADAAEAMRRHVHPGRATVVVVGAADAVAGPLEAIGIGPLTIHPGPRA
ncbi:MAG: insulinase family protein [Gemmatimonadetes bacterium]|nr:insulinase family protein [Gemmatimonadota bacterium]